MRVRAILFMGCAIGAIAMYLSTAHAGYYSARSISARVIDADTGEPIAGANIVAVWQLEDPIAAKGQGELELMEDVTNSNGNFHFPEWGPKPVPSSAFPGTRLTNNDPRIILFKTGYVPAAVYNDSHSSLLGDPNDVGAAVRDSQWDQKSIKLKKFQGNAKEYASLVSGVLTDVGGDDCGWKKMPRMVVALNRESDRLKHEGVRYTAANPSINWLVANEAALKCGSVKDFLREYLK